MLVTSIFGVCFCEIFGSVGSGGCFFFWGEELGGRERKHQEFSQILHVFHGLIGGDMVGRENRLPNG